MGQIESGLRREKANWGLFFDAAQNGRFWSTHSIYGAKTSQNVAFKNANLKFTIVEKHACATKSEVVRLKRFSTE